MAACCKIAFVTNCVGGHPSNEMTVLFRHGSIALVIAVEKDLVVVCAPDWHGAVDMCYFCVNNTEKRVRKCRVQFIRAWQPCPEKKNNHKFSCSLRNEFKHLTSALLQSIKTHKVIRKINMTKRTIVNEREEERCLVVSMRP